MAKKTWREKLNAHPEPEVCALEKPFGGFPIGARLLVATPGMVKEWVDAIPPGQVRTVAELREDLAAAAGADGTCPLTTGIFLRILGEVALEDLAEGKSEESVTPFWRVVDPKSPLAKKLSCGSDFIVRRRALESV